MTPYTALCRVCEYQSTDICDPCLENNLSEFEPKTLPFALLRTFSMDEYAELPNGAKGKLLAYYIIKVMEGLNGQTDDRERGVRVPAPLKKSGVLYDSKTLTASCADRPEKSNGKGD
jgi:hypothetical protein